MRITQLATACFRSWLGTTSENQSWQDTSDLSVGTINDNMGQTFNKAGFSGSPADKLKNWLKSMLGKDGSASNLARDLYCALPAGLTFFNRFDSSLTPQFALGSATPTFTASRNATTPATYIDADGVLQLTTTSNEGRFTKGYYDTTGFHSREGVLIEGAATNLLVRTDGTASAGGQWTGWSSAKTIAGAETVSNNAIPELTSISGAVSQRVFYIGEAGDGGTILRQDSTKTATGSVSQNDVLSISFWGKSQTGLVDANFTADIQSYNAADAGLTFYQQAPVTLTTEWKRYTVTHTITDATVSKVLVELGCNGNITVGDNIDFEFWGVQLEKAPYATSFIPTTAAALTRNAETLKGEIADNRTAATEACVVKLSPAFANSVVTYAAIIDTDSKQRLMRFGSLDNDVDVFANATDSGSSVILDLVNENWTANTEFTLGYNMQSGTSPYIAGFYNGVADGTNETSDDFTAPAWGTYFWIGTDKDTSANFNGIIQSIAFFNRVLTAAEHATMASLL